MNNGGFVASHVSDKGLDDKPSAHPWKCMQCLAPSQLPVMNALAKAFTVCDHWFASLPGPTWPNRFFVHAASSGGFDDSPSGLQEAWQAEVGPGYSFANGTIYDRLGQQKLDFRLFHGDSFPIFGAIHAPTVDLDDHSHDFAEFEARINADDFTASYVVIEPDYGLNFVTNKFACGTSMHPTDDVTRGEALIKRVYEVLRRSRVWRDSALVITFDEHGGFYDHVPPPAATPPGDPPWDEDNNKHGFRFDQLGVRVPALVVSPWIPPNQIDDTRYDHTSILATLERLFGLAPLTGRDAAANDFLHLFSAVEPRGDDAPMTLPDPAVSGFPGCDGDDAKGAGIAALVSAPLRPALRPFLLAAASRHLRTLAPADRAPVIQRVSRIATNTEALEYLSEAKRAAIASSSAVSTIKNRGTPS